MMPFPVLPHSRKAFYQVTALQVCDRLFPTLFLSPSGHAAVSKEAPGNSSALKKDLLTFLRYKIGGTKTLVLDLNVFLKIYFKS